MKLTEVLDARAAREFIMLPVRLYKNEKNWIRPLDKDVDEVFDTKANKYFRHGECTRWILSNDEGTTIGRVAAFIDRKTANSGDQPTGGMGFFECINNREAAFALFDVCKEWLMARGMEAMDGPINFGDREKWWGLHVQGDFEPNYCMPYHFGYYREFFEDYGFKNYFEQYTYHRPVQGDLPEIYVEKAGRIAKDKNYRFVHIDKKQLPKFAEDFREVYNQAWVKHAGVKGMSQAQAMSAMNRLKPILDEKIVWFAYYGERPIAFFIMIPEVNQIFKHLNGKFDLWSKMKFMYHKLTGSCRKIFGVAFGVVPDFQGRGLEAAIVEAVAQVVQPAKRYDEFEMNWIGDFNPKMMKIAESIGGQIRKVHITYRKLFDENKPFKRMPVIH